MAHSANDVKLHSIQCTCCMSKSKLMFSCLPMYKIYVPCVVCLLWCHVEGYVTLLIHAVIKGLQWESRVGNHTHDINSHTSNIHSHTMIIELTTIATILGLMLYATTCKVKHDLIMMINILGFWSFQIQYMHIYMYHTQVSVRLCRKGFYIYIYIYIFCIFEFVIV